MSTLFEIITPEVIDNNKLIEKDIVYFDKLCSTITCYPDSIMFNGRVKQLYFENPYTTIINEARWTASKKNKFELYITDKFGSPDEFNQYVMTKRMKSYNSKANNVSFVHDPEFNLAFLTVNGTHVDCYARESKYNGVCKFISSSNNTRFYDDIVNYLRLIKHLPSICKVKTDAKIVEALKFELNMGYHAIEGEIKLISNNKKDLCLAYIPLDQLSKGRCDKWWQFVDQLAFDSQKHLFMAWIYSVFVDNDFSRQVLWLEGEAITGKSRIFSVLGKVLRKYNTNLFKSITDRNNFDKFSIEGFDRCRLALFADANEADFFKRRDIHTMTGGDFVTINRKNKPVQTKNIMVKIAVYSNHAPIIDKKMLHETSRLIHLWIDPQKVHRDKWDNSVNFESELEKQFFFFLYECKEYYYKLRGYDGLLKEQS